MLQWLPGSRSEVIWNDREGDHFVSHILDVHTRKKRTLPAPVYALSPDGKWALAPDFRRLHDWRPGYGYAGIPDRNAKVQAPDDAGIWRIDLDDRQIQPDSALLAKPPKFLTSARDWTGASHWFNHLLFSPDGSRFSFLHRWGVRQPNGTSRSPPACSPRARTARDLFAARPQRRHLALHLARPASHILAWAWHPSHGNKFYLFQDKTDQVEVVGPDVMTVNGHCTYLPGNRWILNDTYPGQAARAESLPI